MICPVCSNDMIDVEYKGIELDYCTKCHGVWFDSEELELLLDKMEVQDHGLAMDDILGSPEAETTEHRRKCPICGQKMKKVALGEPEIIIDACPEGHGLWFDGDEVTQLLKQLTKASAKQDSKQQVITFLGEVFKAEEPEK